MCKQNVREDMGAISKHACEMLVYSEEKKKKKKIGFIYKENHKFSADDKM